MKTVIFMKKNEIRFVNNLFLADEFIAIIVKIDDEKISDERNV